MLNEDGNLDGMVSTHVDDFDQAGRETFVEEVTKKISAALDVFQVENDHFRFAGIDVRKVEDRIEISMNIRVFFINYDSGIRPASKTVLEYSCSLNVEAEMHYWRWQQTSVDENPGLVCYKKIGH